MLHNGATDYCVARSGGHIVTGLENYFLTPPGEIVAHDFERWLYL
jgi:hypothetical protein